MTLAKPFLEVTHTKKCYTITDTTLKSVNFSVSVSTSNTANRSVILVSYADLPSSVDANALLIKDENKKPRPEQYQFRFIGMDAVPAGVDPRRYFV